MAMKQYNRALDFTALSLNELRKGNHVLSAKLLAKAAAEPDFVKAIQILEASNKQAFALEAQARVTAKKKVKADLEDMDDGDIEDADDEEIVAESENPLDEIVEDEDEDGEDGDPAAAMASVLAKMVRRSR